MVRCCVRCGNSCFLAWINGLRDACPWALVPRDDPDIIAVDGKTSRRSHDRRKGCNPLHLVSAWAARQRIVLGQQATEEKSNEITAILLLLKHLDLKGALVTMDAMETQTDIARAIRDGGWRLLHVAEEELARPAEPMTSSCRLFHRSRGRATPPSIAIARRRCRGQPIRYFTQTNRLLPGFRQAGRVRCRISTAQLRPHRAPKASGIGPRTLALAPGCKTGIMAAKCWHDCPQIADRFEDAIVGTADDLRHFDGAPMIFRAHVRSRVDCLSLPVLAGALAASTPGLGAAAFRPTSLWLTRDAMRAMLVRAAPAGLRRPNHMPRRPTGLPCGRSGRQPSRIGGGLRGGRRSWSVIAAFVQLDLLEPRPTELDNVAARFVVAKAPVTLSVAAKPLMFADNLARFEHCASRQQA